VIVLWGGRDGCPRPPHPSWRRRGESLLDGRQSVPVDCGPRRLDDLETEAHERCRALDDLGLHWIEEPIRHDAYTESARLADVLRTPVQIGENFAGPRAMSLALGHRACDLVMPDLERIGGVSGWTTAAALADVAGVPMSSHLFPEFSAHLLAATPTAHWLEYVDWADPILRDPLRVVDGHATPPDRPGAGIEWDTDAVARYRIG
jgi:mandelate racemase